MYLPFLTEPRMLNMGLRPLNPTQWMEPDEEWTDFHRHKQNCLSERPDDVVQTLLESNEAQQELYTRLRQHLITDHGKTFTSQVTHSSISQARPSFRATPPHRQSRPQVSGYKMISVSCNRSRKDTV